MSTDEEIAAEIVRRREAQKDVLRGKIKKRLAQVAALRGELRAIECEVATVTRRTRSKPTGEGDVVLVLKVVRMVPGLRLGELADDMGHSRDQTRRLLRVLESRGQIRREGTSTFTRYFPT